MLVLSQHLAERYPLTLFGNDARGVGYLLKHRIADLEDFLAAVRKVAAGGTALDPEVVARMLGRPRRANPLDRLTPRERDVLALIVEGLSNRGIAERMHVGPPAVEKHVTSIFEKLELGHDRSDHRRVLAVLTVLGPHSGSAARNVVPPPAGLSSASVPPSAATRSASPCSPLPRSGSAPPRPSSATVITSVVAAALDGHRDRGGLRVLGDVGQRLGDEEVARGLDVGRVAGRRRARARPAARRPRPGPRARPRGRGP